MFPFTILAVSPLLPLTKLPCVASSPDAALIIARQAFPGHLVAVLTPTPKPLWTA